MDVLKKNILNKIEHIRFSNDNSLRSRILATIYIFIELILLAIIIAKYGEFGVFYLIAHILFFPFGILLLIKPKWSILWAVYFILDGFLLVWTSEGLIGLLMLLLANLFFIKLDMLRNRKCLKIILFAFVFLLAIFLLHLKNGFRIKWIYVSDLSLGLLLYISIFILMHDDLKKYYKKNPTISLENLKLNNHQKKYVEGILKGNSLRTIAKELHVSESVAKREVKTVYALFDVSNHKELKNLLQQYDIT